MCIYYGIWNLRDAYVANHFDTCKLTFARQKSTLWIKQKISNFDIDKTFRALKWLLGCFKPITLKSDWMLITVCFSNWIERFSNLLLSSHNIAAQWSQFPRRKSKLANSAVHVESVASEYVYFPNQAVKTFVGKIVWYHKLFQIITL